MSLQAAIASASAGEEIRPALVEEAFAEIMDGKASPVQIAALLVALRTKGETVGEITAAARALRARAETAPLLDPRTVDTCGTGGDGAGTFNISTVAAFVVAGAGVPVAKHGNRAASSLAGSFDVLEALGVHADLPIRDAARVLAEVGIAPFFARRAHPAGIDGPGVEGGSRLGPRPQRACGRRDLPDRLPLGSQRHQEGGDPHGGSLPVHDLREGRLEEGGGDLLAPGGGLGR